MYVNSVFCAWHGLCTHHGAVAGLTVAWCRCGRRVAERRCCCLPDASAPYQAVPAPPTDNNDLLSTQHVAAQPSGIDLLASAAAASAPDPGPAPNPPAASAAAPSLEPPIDATAAAMKVARMVASTEALANAVMTTVRHLDPSHSLSLRSPHAETALQAVQRWRYSCPKTFVGTDATSQDSPLEFFEESLVKGDDIQPSEDSDGDAGAATTGTGNKYCRVIHSKWLRVSGPIVDPDGQCDDSDNTNDPLLQVMLGQWNYQPSPLPDLWRNELCRLKLLTLDGIINSASGSNDDSVQTPHRRPTSTPSRATPGRAGDHAHTGAGPATTPSSGRKSRQPRSTAVTPVASHAIQASAPDSSSKRRRSSVLRHSAESLHVDDDNDGDGDGDDGDGDDDRGVGSALQRTRSGAAKRFLQGQQQLHGPHPSKHQRGPSQQHRVRFEIDNG
jgi:hypothetical protein